MAFSPDSALVAGPASPPQPRGSAAGPLLALERAVVRQVLDRLGGAPVAAVLPNGEEMRRSGCPPVARVVFRDAGAVLGLAGTMPDLRFGDAYADGRIEVEGDLVALVEAVFSGPEPQGVFQGAAERWRALRRRHNSLRGSRAHVEHHYDLGNDFYALWLDREMLYTCAYFADPAATLEAAQLAKMEHVARKLRLRPGERVVEAGCGWGALALHLARQYGVHVRAFNISTAQIAWARERARACGLAGRVEFVDDDYRNVTGSCDAFVSVGMLEHVGPEHYGDLRRVIDRVLSPDGRGLLHFIGRNRPMPFSAFVERRIFPGAHAPALSEVATILEPADLSVLDVENLRLHYVRTLEHWLERFERQRAVVAATHGERFVRMWRLYLAGSVAGFRSGWLQLFQILFARGRTNRVPWTRADLYQDA